MRMRKKKHTSKRIEDCGDLLISNYDILKNNPHVFFNEKNPIHLEIGCGKGKFILETAMKNPNINYIAIEKIPDVIVLAMEKIKSFDIKNVKFINSDISLLCDFLKDNFIERIYINFCDPWEKNGYRKKRLTHSNFLGLYKRILNSNSEIHFKTDNKKLFEFTLNEMCEFGLKLKNITLDLHNSKFAQENIMTEYETMFCDMGMDIYRLEAIVSEEI